MPYKIILPPNKKLYFVSDAHFGYPDYEQSLAREKKMVQWLDNIKPHVHELFLLGDMFEFWFEWKRAVPSGFSRFLGKLAEFTDQGIKVNYLIGNHDLWTSGYLVRETGVHLLRKPITAKVNNKTIYMAHGDGLGPFDRKYKLMKWFFTRRFLQRLFALLHPDIAIGIAHFFSQHSRKANKEPHFMGENEWLVIHSKEQLKTTPCDYFIYGHRHLAMEIPLNPTCTQIYTGDWITHFTYAEFDGDTLALRKHI